VKWELHVVWPVTKSVLTFLFDGVRAVCIWLTSVQIKAALYTCARESAHASSGLVECESGYIWAEGKN
jgi:hypothetical protein